MNILLVEEINVIKHMETVASFIGSFSSQWRIIHSEGRTQVLLVSSFAS